MNTVACKDEPTIRRGRDEVVKGRSWGEDEDLRPEVNFRWYRFTHSDAHRFFF